MVDDELQIDKGRENPLKVSNQQKTEPGGRYIDFLVPGLLGMNLMGGGLFGVGFATVDLRIRKVLKRFLATPMRKSDFLAGNLLLVRALPRGGPAVHQGAAADATHRCAAQGEPRRGQSPVAVAGAVHPHGLGRGELRAGAVVVPLELSVSTKPRDGRPWAFV